MKQLAGSDLGVGSARWMDGVEGGMGDPLSSDRSIDREIGREGEDEDEAVLFRLGNVV